MKKYILFLCTLSLFSNCSKEDTVPMDTQIIGAWKLVSAKIIVVNSSYTVDYSDQNIIYDFQPDGILFVSEDNEVHEHGTHEYIFEEGYLGSSSNSSGNTIPFVTINMYRKYFYQRIDGKMILRNSYLDGPDLTFERNHQ